MNRSSSTSNEQPKLLRKSHVSDAERAFLADVAYPASPATLVDGNTGNWTTVGERELTNGLEIYALQQDGTHEIVFAVRGSDSEPDGSSDWGLNGANASFSGMLHPQVQSAIEYVNQFMIDHEDQDEDLVYSTTGHSKGGGIAQILAHTFGLEGTALDPAPGGAVVESPGYAAFVAQLGIDPPGIPEHGFTNYVEEGSLVGDYLENLTIPIPLLAHPVLNALVERFTSFSVEDNGFVRIGSHLGDTVTVDLVPGSSLTHLNVLEQHSPIDDTIALATLGPSYLIGQQIAERTEVVENLEEIKVQVGEASLLLGQGTASTNGFIDQLDDKITGLRQEISTLQELRLDKLEGEYGYADTWMRGTDFLVENPHVETVEALRDVYQRGLDDLIDANLYLNAHDLESLSEARDAFVEMQGATPIPGISEGSNRFEAEIAGLNEQISELNNQQVELLQQRFGGELDSWMPTDGLIASILPENSAFDNLTSDQIEEIQNPETMQVLQGNLLALNDIVLPASDSYTETPDLLYTTQPGDTLTEIAGANHTNVEDLLFFNPELEDPDHIQAGEEINIPPEGWELPEGEPMLDADGNPILLASNDPETAEQIVDDRARDEQTGQTSPGDAQQVRQPTEAEQAATHRGAELDVMNSEIDLRNAVNTGDGGDIAREGLGYLSSLDDYRDTVYHDGFLSDSQEAMVDGLGHGIGLGQAIDEGNGWQITGNSVDLLLDIENYAESNDSDSIGESGTGYLNAVSSAFDLSLALNDGDGWQIASSTTSLLNDIDQIHDIDGGSGALGGAASMAGLAVNIASLDDVLASGDGLQIAYATASTVNNAVTTYNMAATAAGYSTIGTFGLSEVPVLGYVAAAVQLVEGDTTGAAVTAASAYLMTCGPYGWAAAAVLQIANMLGAFGDDDPPNATAAFSFDADGNVIMSVDGDSEMTGAAEAYASPLLATIQGYQDMGGRVEIDGSLPSVQVEAGSDPKICYTSEYGGQVAIAVGDPSRMALEMRGALYARDRGDRIDEAINLATNDQGDIDFVRVDAHLAVMGFTRHGITYIYGESTTPRIGQTYGNGVFHGGGNADGPEGEHFIARDQDITSLPLQDEQRPSQRIGRILRSVGLQQNFAGVGAYLLAAGLGLDADQAVAAVVPGQMETVETNTEYSKPLDAVQLAQYQYGNPDGAGSRPIAQDPAAVETDISDLADEQELQAFVNATRPGGTGGSTSQDNILDHASTLHFPDIAEFVPPAAGSAPLPLLDAQQQDSRHIRLSPAATLQQEAEAAVPAVAPGTPQETGAAAQPTNVRIPGDQLPDEVVEPLLPPEVEQGSMFTMEQDSSLRFLPTALTEELGDTPYYSSSDESSTLVSFGKSEHGEIQLAENGDIRFQAETGFVGTASFEYDLRGPDGEISTHRALVVVEDVNDPPQLEDDHCTINEGDVFYLDHLLDNDSDADGDILTLDHFRGLDHGEVSLMDNRLVFIPEEGFTGTIDFSYWVRDGVDTYPYMARADLTILEQYPEVNTTDDHFIILEDHPLVTTVDKLLGNDLVDDWSIHLTELQDPNHGRVSMDEDGTITFVPDPDYAGTGAGFSYTVEDDLGNVGTAWANIEVLDLRDSPLVFAATYIGANEDEAITFTSDEIARFVTDPDGDLLHLDYVTNVEGGRVEVENGLYTFIPDSDYAGPASFDYQANDNRQGTVRGHLEFDISPVNDPVETGEDFLRVAEENSLTMNQDELLANDFDPEGTPVEFVSLGTAIHGTVTLDGDGNITFAPEPEYFGEDAGFEYVVRDGEGIEATGFVNVEVENVNDVPEIIATGLTTQEDQAIIFDADTVHEFITDADGDTLTFSLVTNISGGTMTEENGVYTFTPEPDYHGSASIDYRVSDGNDGEVAGILEIDVLSGDDQTDFGDDHLVTMEEVAVTTTVTDLMANDADADGGLSFVGLGTASHGTVSLDGEGNVTFSPEMDYFGDDAGFEYVVRDGEGTESTGFVNVEVENVNDVPEIIATGLTTPEDQSVVFDMNGLAGFLWDADGDSLEFTVISNVSGGTMTEENDVYTFTPDPEYHGPATLDYTVTDGNGGEVAGRLNIDVLSGDDQTDFGDDHLVTTEEVAVTTTVADLMVNDTDADGGLSFVGLGTASHGTVSLDGEGNVTFSPEMDYFGEDAGFGYVAVDGEGHQATGRVVVEVENVNDQPEVLLDRLHILEDREVIFSSEEIAGFIYDPDGDSLNFTSLSAAEGGSFRIENGLYVFTPDPDFYGETTFEYTVNDGNGEDVSGLMLVDVTPVNDLPVVPGLSAAMTEDGEITFSVESLMAGAVDAEDGTALDFSGIVGSSHGDAWADSDGLIHFLPDSNFFGMAAFTYGVADSEAGVGAGTVTIEVAGENDAPVAMNDGSILAWGNNSYDNVYSPSMLLANDYDVDGDFLEIDSLSRAEYGTVSLDVNGNIHYQAQSDDWVGVDYFTYTIEDGYGGQAEAVARVDVKLNTMPDAYSEILFSQEDVIALIDQKELLVNDFDVDGDTFFISAVGNAEHGSVTLLPDGRIGFTPELNFNNEYPGQASFEYTVSDGISDPVTAVAFVDLESVNDTPVLQGESLTGAVEDNSFSFTPDQLLANDFDVEMTSPFENDSMAVTGVFGASHGSLSYLGTGSIVYTPEANFHGVDTFCYQVTDANGGVSEVTSEISVRSVNDNPVVQEDRATAAEDAIWNKYGIAGLLGNDTDVDGDALSLVDPYVSEGSAQVNVSGGYLWVKPAFGENRVDVSYTVSDGHGGSADSRLTIDHISEHNFAPEFTGLYEVVWESGWETWFTFQAVDRNGDSNSWAVDNGDIATISAAEVHGGRILTSTNNQDNFSFKFEGNFDLGSLILTATDYSGASGSIVVEISNLAGNGRHVYGPVILDLDGDGVELLGIEEGVAFDWNRDGDAEVSGWVAGDDGFLVYDYDHDMLVTRADELMLREYLPGAETDLEGLRAFDSNEDGIFSGNDTSWNDFGVWQDRNSNGLTDEGEFHHLDELGIRDIELESNSNEQEIAGNTVYGTAVYHRQDGSTGEVGDVALRGEEIVFTNMDSGECETGIEPGTEGDVGDATLDTSSTGLAEAGAPHANGEDGTAAELEFDQPDISSSDYTETEPLPADGEEGVPVKPESDTSDVPMTATATEDPLPACGAEEMISEQEPALLMDEAEANRLAQQFQSDAAACPTGADFEQPVSVEIYHVDAVAADDLYQADDTPDELLALA